MTTTRIMTRWQRAVYAVYMVVVALLLLLIPKFIGIYFLVKNALDTTCRRGDDDWDDGDDHAPHPAPTPTPQPQWATNAHEYELVSRSADTH